MTTNFTLSVKDILQSLTVSEHWVGYKLGIFDQILFSVPTKSNTFSNFYIEGRERDETKTNLKYSRIFLTYSNFHLLKINLDKMGSQYDPSMLNEYLPQYYRRLFPYKSYIQWIRSVKKYVLWGISFLGMIWIVDAFVKVLEEKKKIYQR